MKANNYNVLKIKIEELNKLHDEINLIEWNKEDGPKFSSVEEMKEFENRIINGDLDYILGESVNENTEKKMIDTFSHTIDNYFFYIYTFESDNNFITFLTIKDLNENYTLNYLCGNKTKNIESAKTYFEKLKTDITTNTLNYIFENMIVDVEKNINILKDKYEKLTNES